MSQNMYRGVYPILVTPFLDDREESIDMESFRRCISFMKTTGVTGITVAGVLGEADKLTDHERQLLIETAVDEIRQGETPDKKDERLKLCVGTTHQGTTATVALSKMALNAGADGVMISPTKSPSGPQPSDDDIVELYQRVSDACPELPIIVQDLPSLTGVFMSINVLSRIASTITSVRAIKLESPPTIHRIISLNADTGFRHSECTILSGLGALYAGFDLDTGVSGFMTGFAFPEILVAMNNLSKQGRRNEAYCLYKKYLDLIVFEQQPGGLAIRKEVYRRRNLISSSKVRHPGSHLSPALHRAIDDQLLRSFPDTDIQNPISFSATSIGQ
jgi:4-hydroxy-tetrahydrodipicolinate synthase